MWRAWWGGCAARRAITPTARRSSREGGHAQVRTTPPWMARRRTRSPDTALDQFAGVARFPRAAAGRGNTSVGSLMASTVPRGRGAGPGKRGRAWCSAPRGPPRSRSPGTALDLFAVDTRFPRAAAERGNTSAESLTASAVLATPPTARWEEECVVHRPRGPRTGAGPVRWHRPLPPGRGGTGGTLGGVADGVRGARDPSHGRVLGTGSDVSIDD